MPIDLSQVSRNEDEELIPSGVYRVQAEIMPGGYGPGDLLKKSERGTLGYLNLRCHVAEGDYKGATIYDMVMVETIGKLPTPNDEGAVRRGRTRIRRMVESARCVDVNSVPAEDLSKRLEISDYGDVHGLVYYAQVGIGGGNDKYPDKNIIEGIVTPADADWPGTPATPAGVVRPLKIAPPKDMDDEIPFS
jgi:hypothetical protein